MQVIEIAEKQFLQLMEQSHALTRAVLREYERNLWRMGHQLKNTTGNMQMERKIAAKLWKLGRDFGVDTEDGVMIDIDLTITLMADLVVHQGKMYLVPVRFLRTEVCSVMVISALF